MFARLSIIAIAVLLLAIAGLGGMIWLGGPPTPPVNQHLAARDKDIGAGLADRPTAESFAMRDQTAMSFRRYPGHPGSGVAVLVHGSSGSGAAVHQLARTLAQAGVTAIAIDVRGHGATGPHGDIAYAGQLDDDIADLAGMLDQAYPRENRLLVGHSSGGGFVLRIASSASSCAFDGYVALSPYLNYQASTNRPDGGWSAAGMARIIALSVANGFGVHLFDGLPAVNFAITPGARNRTYAYSFRLLQAFGLPMQRWEDRVRAITRPASVLVGAEDELFYADRFAGVFNQLNPSIRVQVTPGVDHMGMVLAPTAGADVVAEVKRLLAAPALPRC